ncbi:MAG TPA: hypothetical protein VGH29_14615, partial [Candidatus Binataceae bacterium]
LRLAISRRGRAALNLAMDSLGFGHISGTYIAILCNRLSGKWAIVCCEPVRCGSRDERTD